MPAAATSRVGCIYESMIMVLVDGVTYETDRPARRCTGLEPTVPQRRQSRGSLTEPYSTLPFKAFITIHLHKELSTLYTSSHLRSMLLASQTFEHRLAT